MTTQQETLPDKGCGRLDDHDPHPWTRPRIMGVGAALPPRRYQCEGPPVIEGGNPARTGSRRG